MFDILDNLSEKGGMTIIVVSIFAIFLSGILFGSVYLIMDKAQTGLASSDCVIEGNAYVSSCQDLWDMSFNKFLDLKSILIWVSYFFIFSLVLGLVMLGYSSGKNPAMLGVILVITVVTTYFGIEIANMYRTMLNNAAFFDMMLPFQIYNKIMLNFPWFVAFVGMFSMILGIVNFQKARINSQTSDLDY